MPQNKFLTDMQLELPLRKEIEVLQLSPPAYEEAAAKVDKNKRKEKAHLKRITENYYNMQFKFTAGNRLVELRQIIDFATQNELEVEPDILMLFKLYRAAEKQLYGSF